MGKTGTECFQELPSSSGREAKAKQLLMEGNVPPFLFKFCPVEFVSGETKIVIWVSPDYLSLGDDKDWIRIPLAPKTAQDFLATVNAVLPTPKMVDEIWRQAGVKVEPVTYRAKKPGDPGMTTTGAFKLNHEAVQRVLSLNPDYKQGLLVAGQRKDVVVHNKLMANPEKVAIYGWHRKNGVPIQNLNTGSHSKGYVDYSHGIRMVSRVCQVNGVDRDLGEVMIDPVLSVMLNGGPLLWTGYK
jgi:hypothetical protein